MSKIFQTRGKHIINFTQSSSSINYRFTMFVFFLNKNSSEIPYKCRIILKFQHFVFFLFHIGYKLVTTRTDQNRTAQNESTLTSSKNKRKTFKIEEEIP